MRFPLPPSPRPGQPRRDIDARHDLHAALIPLLHLVLERRTSEFSTLCEIGCGSGRLLRECTERLPQFTGYVGLNGDRAQTYRNRALSCELPIRFESMSLHDWVRLHAQPGTAYLTDAHELEGYDASLLSRLWQAWSGPLRPFVLAIAVPLPPASGAERHPALIQEIERYAKPVRYSVDMPASTGLTRLIVAEL
nr:A388 [uncultured bacterium]